MFTNVASKRGKFFQLLWCYLAKSVMMTISSTASDLYIHNPTVKKIFLPNTAMFVYKMAQHEINASAAFSFITN